MFLSSILRGSNGDLELNRVIGGFGSLAYVLVACGLVVYKTAWVGNDFDITAFCLAFPGGLAVAVGGTAGAVAIKDRNVAVASVVAQTGSKPATPPNPAPVVNPELTDGGDNTSPAPTDEGTAPWTKAS